MLVIVGQNNFPKGTEMWASKQVMLNYLVFLITEFTQSDRFKLYDL